MNNEILRVKRNILLNPGPATTTDSVKYAQVVPDICPRETEFQDLMTKLRMDLLPIVKASPEKYSTVLFSGSGTLCIDSCLSSLLPEKSKVLVINNGSYSQRAVEVCKYYGLPYLELKYKEDKLPNLLEIDEVLRSNSDIRLVYTTHHETGTGLLNPVRSIGNIVHKTNAVFVVDTTSSFAMIEIDIEADNIDFLMSSSQKGVMAMSGLAFVIGNKKMMLDSEKYPKRSYYCNLYRQYDYFEKTGQMNFTPPVQTAYALRQALDELYSEGLEAKYRRHKKSFDKIIKSLNELGFKSLINLNESSNILVSVLYPDDLNWNFKKIHDYCYERGFTIYPGKVNDIPSFRLSVFGAIDERDIDDFMLIFKEALEVYKIGIPVFYNHEREKNEIK